MRKYACKEDAIHQPEPYTCQHVHKHTNEQPSTSSPAPGQPTLHNGHTTICTSCFTSSHRSLHWALPEACCLVLTCAAPLPATVQPFNRTVVNMVVMPKPTSERDVAASTPPRLTWWERRTLRTNHKCTPHAAQCACHPQDTSESRDPNLTTFCKQSLFTSARATLTGIGTGDQPAPPCDQLPRAYRIVAGDVAALEARGHACSTTAFRIDHTTAPLITGQHNPWVWDGCHRLRQMLRGGSQNSYAEWATPSAPDALLRASSPWTSVTLRTSSFLRTTPTTRVGVNATRGPNPPPIDWLPHAHRLVARDSAALEAHGRGAQVVRVEHATVPLVSAEGLGWPRPWVVGRRRLWQSL